MEECTSVVDDFLNVVSLALLFGVGLICLMLQDLFQGGLSAFNLRRDNSLLCHERREEDPRVLDTAELAVKPRKGGVRVHDLRDHRRQIDAIYGQRLGDVGRGIIRRGGEYDMIKSDIGFYGVVELIYYWQ